MKTNDLLNAAKTKKGIRTDYLLAQKLETTTGRISHWRTGRNQPDEEICFRLAEMLEIEPSAVIAAVRLENEKEHSKVEFWRKQAGKYARALGIVAVLASGGVQAAIGQGYTAAVKITAVCIMRNQG
jgi:transcriptional regulator with XRE-family HTH domain